LSGETVHIALSSGAYNQLTVFQAHVDNAIVKIKFFVKLIEAIIDCNFVVFVKSGFCQQHSQKLRHHFRQHLQRQYHRDSMRG
jgi:hypothetical protein